MSSIGAYFCGVLGGLLPELLGLYRLRTLSVREWPEALSRRSYWIVTLAFNLVAAGGIPVLWTLSGTQLSPLLAANVGAAAPVVIEGLAKALPRAAPSHRVG